MPFQFKCASCSGLFSRHYKSAKQACDPERRFCSHRCYSNFYSQKICVSCPSCGKEKLVSPSNKARAYCNRSCYENHRGGKTINICKECKSEFSVKSCESTRVLRCKICRHQREKRIAGRVVKCVRCGNRVVQGAADSKRGIFRKHCSESCRRPARLTNCANCKKEFRVGPKENRKFCSVACYRRFTGETSIEKSIRLALEDIGLNFVQEGRLGRYSIDFLCQSQRLCIEVDGTYWHRNKARDARKTNYIRDAGFRLIRISESEINTTENLTKMVIGKIKSGHSFPDHRRNAANAVRMLGNEPASLF